jgi:ketosteroid isomerase-like protein
MNGVAGSDDNRTDEVLQLNDRLAVAERHKDVESLGLLLARDYVGIDATGRRVGRQDVLERFGSSDLTIAHHETSDVLVRVFGTTAIVTGRAVMRGSFMGNVFAGEFRYTDIWVPGPNGWQVVASHVTPEAT